MTVHAGHHEPLELGRTLLAAGAIERRAKRKAEAREVLERAEAIFEQLGARLWLERARLELERTGVYRTAARELSAAERQVADLAARGATNKENRGRPLYEREDGRGTSHASTASSTFAPEPSSPHISRRWT
jgi:hypothetical protein